MSFLDQKRAAAVLKHAVLLRYVRPFAMKTGAYSPGRRVAVIDAYAGVGRYANGDEGSPALLMREAKLVAQQRQLECYLIEANRTSFAQLKSVVDLEGQGLKIFPFCGRAEDELPGVMAQVREIPAFVFLNPFGLMASFDTVREVFKRPAGFGVPATEMLINFNAGPLRRAAGLLASDRQIPATLNRMDEVCGGDWWRKTWADSDGDRAQAELAVIRAYARRVAAACNTGFWMTPVRNRASHKPVYYLIFFTRHPDGLGIFGDALSSGLEEWRRVVYRVEDASTFWDSEQAFVESEQQMADAWVDEIEKNLRTLLAEGRPFPIMTKYSQVLGSAFGLAREEHLRTAWKRLHQEGITSTDSNGELIKKTISPAVPM
jgi:three-Cys-motif partner protein